MFYTKHTESESTVLIITIPLKRKAGLFPITKKKSEIKFKKNIKIWRKYSNNFCDFDVTRNNNVHDFRLTICCLRNYTQLKKKHSRDSKLSLQILFSSSTDLKLTRMVASSKMTLQSAHLTIGWTLTYATIKNL